MGELVKKSATAVAVANEANQYLTFSLSGEMYAVGILNVKEIIEYGSLTEIPMMPTFIRGVINLRGAVVPVIDLTARFGGSPTQIGRRTCIIILELRDTDTHQDIGVIVDAVSEVIEIPTGEIEPPMELAIGLIDVKNSWVEPPELVAERLRLVLKFVEPERIHVTPDCGFSQTARFLACRKLANMVEGVRLIRCELRKD